MDADALKEAGELAAQIRAGKLRCSELTTEQQRAVDEWFREPGNGLPISSLGDPQGNPIYGVVDLPKKQPEQKKGPRGGRYTEARTKEGRPYRRYF